MEHHFAKGQEHFGYSPIFHGDTNSCKVQKIRPHQSHQEQSPKIQILTTLIRSTTVCRVNLQFNKLNESNILKTLTVHAQSSRPSLWKLLFILVLFRTPDLLTRNPCPHSLPRLSSLLTCHVKVSLIPIHNNFLQLIHHHNIHHQHPQSHVHLLLLRSNSQEEKKSHSQYEPSLFQK